MRSSLGTKLRLIGFSVFFVMVATRILLFSKDDWRSIRTTSYKAVEKVEASYYIHDKWEKGTLLSKLMAEKREMLIFRIPALSCSSCYIREISVLKNYLKTNTNIKVIIISAFRTYRDYRVFESYAHSCNLSVYNQMNPLSNYEELNQPYYVLIDQKLNVLKIHQVSKENGYLSLSFLNSLN